MFGTVCLSTSSGVNFVVVPASCMEEQVEVETPPLKQEVMQKVNIHLSHMGEGRQVVDKSSVVVGW